MVLSIVVPTVLWADMTNPFIWLGLVAYVPLLLLAFLPVTPVGGAEGESGAGVATFSNWFLLTRRALEQPIITTSTP